MEGINLTAYEQHGSGFGQGSQAEVDNLLKALEAGSITGRETDGLLTASGSPLKLESLEGTLKSLTFGQEHIKLWKRIPKMAAFNTVEEYLRFVSPGQDRGGFVSETELPEEEDSVYQRASQLVKFMGITKSVSLAMEMVNTTSGVGALVQREVENASLWILRKVDRGMDRGNADVVPHEFNGFAKQQMDAFSSLDEWQDSEVVIDMRGKRLTEDAIETAGVGITKNFGYADLLMAPPVVLSNFVKEFHSKKLVVPNTTQVTAGIMGQKVNQFASQHGVIDLDDDIFLAAPAPRKTGDAPTSAKAPATPVAVSAAAIADTSTRFLKNGVDDHGDYFYAIAAKNRYGESALVALNGGAVIAIAATESANLKWTAGAGAYAATGYVIYRSVKNPSGAIAINNLYSIFEVTVAQLAAGFDGGAATFVYDRNRFIAGTEQAFMVQNDTQVWSFKQLAPLMKMDLALLAQARRFMVLLYGTPILYAPKKYARFINIGIATV